MTSNGEGYFFQHKWTSEFGLEFRAFLNEADPHKPIRMEYGVALNFKAPSLQDLKWSLVLQWDTDLTPIEAIDRFMEELRGQIADGQESLPTPEYREIMYRGFRIDMDGGAEGGTACIVNAPGTGLNWEFNPITVYKCVGAAVGTSKAHALLEARKVVNRLLSTTEA